MLFGVPLAAENYPNLATQKDEENYEKMRLKNSILNKKYYKLHSV